MLDASPLIRGSLQAGALVVQNATACIPHIYESVAHIQSSRADYIHSLTRLLPPTHPLATCPLIPRTNTRGVVGAPPVNSSEWKSLDVRDPLTSLGSGGLGYYIIYMGYNDVHVCVCVCVHDVVVVDASGNLCM